jgi:SAM-dependent methyltransferase
MKKMKNLRKIGNRTPDQIREHYEVEIELANRLRNAHREERHFLYSSLYDERNRRVPHNPQLTRKLSPTGTNRAIVAQMKFLRVFLNEGDIFLEVGPGDCALSFEVSKYVKQVYAIDICDTMSKSEKIPENFSLILSDGISIPIPEKSVNVAYSSQLMEHLHQDDALDQLHNIYSVLIPGGLYICITPNRLNGPHDVSKYFDEIATGFHLKEYTNSELSSLFRNAGFSKVRAYAGTKGKYTGFSTMLPILCEKLLYMLPSALRKQVSRSWPIKSLLGIRLIAIK